MEPEKRAEFISLFHEFSNSYPYTGNGLRHQYAYEKQRQQGRRNFEAIATAASSKEDITESVFLQLLPHPESTKNPYQGAWVHINYDDAFFREWELGSSQFENNRSADRSQIAKSIFRFVCSCRENPERLSAACDRFFHLPGCQAFSMDMLTPILNAILPDKFLSINDPSRRVINYFTNSDYSPKLIEYPAINITGRTLIQTLNQPAIDSKTEGMPARRKDDLFDMFCYWLVVVKKHDFASQETSIFADFPEIRFDNKELDLQPEYSLTQCAEDTGFEETEIARWIRAINRKKQAIIQGPPGTGKTFIAQKLARHLIGGGDGFTELIQFHPAYTYEDFIQGIRPQSLEGELSYQMVSGRFLEFCNKAASCRDISVLIIDEINRANLSQVFGELMYLLEYRDEKIPLAGSGELFSIPPNARIIGTMNTADRSIALVDNALRRRFAFISLSPNYQVLRRYHERVSDLRVDGLIEVLERLNQEIGDRHYEIGISFFLLPDLEEQIEDIWQMEIEPYLEEYFFDRPEKVDEFRWQKIGGILKSEVRRQT